MGLRLLALACLVGAAFAGPLQRESGSRCSKNCPTVQNPKFALEIGKKYVYEYQGENYITVAGYQKQKARIEGVAEFHYVSQCEFVLKLKNVRIQQKISQGEIRELIHKLEVPVTFAWTDGIVEHVCPSSEESTQSLNIKKGVISSIINSMSKLDSPEEVQETDSFGRCVTQYSVKYVQGLEITKQKSLKSCTNRHTSVTSLVTNPYQSPESIINTLPIFPDETLVCKQLIENKIIKRINCVERATIKPIKHRDSIIQFEGTLTLSLLNVDGIDALQMETPSHQESILYNLQEAQPRENRERELEQLLREMCSKNVGVMDSSVSKDFIKSVTLVKTLSYRSLEKIHNSLKSGQLCSSKKVLDLFVDSLPMAGTDASVKLMVKLLEQKEISGLKAKLWPASLALITRPTTGTIEAVVPLLKIDRSSPVLLGISALVHRFCRLQNCANVPAVQEIVSELNQFLGDRCSSEESDKVFAALKAFGNMGYHGDAHRNIIACAKDSSKPARLRLAAIDAFRRTDKKRPNELLSLYTNTDEDSEIRIAAFSSVIRAADSMQIKEIKRIAERENDEQVSGYVYTFIKNMKKTSSPLKKQMKSLLNDIEIKSPRVNFWTNSKNIELSAFSEMLNIGGGVEADIIHSPENKIPRSIRSSLDADLFGSNINLLEFGVRAEGLEDLVKRLIGLKDKVNKTPSWRMFNSQDVLGDVNADVSLFVRTLNTEIFDVAASDLSAVGEMMQIAEIMNKLALGQKADFSHSFLFVDTHLYIPSVTGKSYSIAVTGSSTVGLTASSKLDVLSFPRNADVHFQFQPSVNVEISTTVGIQSNTHRPDIKLVSRIHMESDAQSRFQIKDGHVALASLTMPSENIAMVKMSTDVLEIDAEHNERQIFERRQMKIDHCLNWLEKPLGISACAKVEVPKPFVRKTFPFITPVGTVELALKKSDLSFKSYEFKVEIPRQAGQLMKYKASLDTPNSQVSRRFAASLEVKSRKDQKEFLMELTSPFKTIGGSGSLALREELIQGSVELHGSSSRFLVANISTEISSSKSRKVYSPAVEVTYKNAEPFRIGGSISVIKGRKQHVTFDLRSSRLLSSTLKGSITKEGKIDLSRKGDWKLSSDIALQSSLANAQIRGAVEKRSKTSQTISTSFSADYQRSGRQQHSVKFSATSQQSLGKMSTNAQFVSSQFPMTNWDLSWDMQRDQSESMKNDITIKYGRNPERQFVNVRQTARIPRNAQGQIKIALKAPQFNIDSELTSTHELQVSEAPKLLLDIDMRYKANQHAKSRLEINVESRNPLKANSRAEIEYAGKKIAYWDEISQTDRNNYEGKANFQWIDNKKFELKYRYHNRSDESNLHHEIETSLRSPSSHAPIKSKASIKLIGKSLELSGQIGSEYSLQAFLNEVGVNHVSIKAPKLEGNVKANSEESKKSLDIDIKVKTRNPQHISAKGLLELGKRQLFEIDAAYSAERQPERKVSFVTKAEINKSSSRQTYVASSRLILGSLLDVSLSESGEISIKGIHEANLVASIKNREPISISYKMEGLEKATLKFSKNHIQKAVIEVEGKHQRNGRRHEISARVSAKSPDHSFEDMEIVTSHQMSRSGSSLSFQSKATLEKSNKVSKAELNADFHPQGMEINAELDSPHPKIGKKAINLSFERSSNIISSRVSIEAARNHVISMTSEIKRKTDGFSTTNTIQTPYDSIKDAKVHFSVDNNRSKRTLLSYLDVNGKRVSDVQVSLSVSSTQTELQGKIQVSSTSEHISFQGLEFEYLRARNILSVSSKAKLANNKEISFSSEIKKEREHINAEVTAITPIKAARNAKLSISIENQPQKKSIAVYADANNERKIDAELDMSSSSSEIELQGKLKTVLHPEIAGHLKIQKRRESLAVQAKIWKGASLSMSSRFNGHQQNNSPKTSETFESSLLDFEASSELSAENSRQYNMKASGQFQPLSVSLSVSRKEKAALNMEVRVCKGEQPICYTLKSYQKSLNNAENYRIYKKVTLDLEKSVGESESEPVGSTHILLSSSEHEFRSKFMIQYQQKTVGYEIRAHKRQNDQDHCSIETHFFLPQRTSRVRASVLHSDNQIMVEAEAIPDSSQPSQKLSFELKKESNLRRNEVSCSIMMSHPGLSKPITVTSLIQKEGKLIQNGKIELQYANGEKSLVAEVAREIERGSNGQKALVWKLYNQDKSMEALLKLMKRNSRDEDMYGYEWSYKSQQSGSKQGGVTIQLSQKRRGRPQRINVKYFTPSIDLQIRGNAENAPSEISFSVEKSGRLMKEIRIQTTDSCVNVEVLRSGPFFRSSLCVNQHRGDTLQFISIDAQCQREKCLDIQVGLDPENSKFLDVVMQWKKEELRQTVIELTGLNEILQDRSLEEIEEELKEKLRHIKNDVLKPKMKTLWRKAKQLKEKLIIKIKENLREHSHLFEEHMENIRNIKMTVLSSIESVIPWEYIYNEVIEPIRQALKCFLEEYAQIILKHVPDFGKIVWDVTKTQLEHCLKKFCTPGTFCHDMFRTYKRYGLKQTKVLVQKKISQTQRQLKAKFYSFGLQDLFRFFEDLAQSVTDKLDNFFGKWFGRKIVSEIIDYLVVYEEKFRKIAVQYIETILEYISDWFGMAEKDEDFRTAKALALDAQKKLIKAWKNKEALAEQSLESMQNSIKESAKKIMDQGVQINKFDTQQGEISLKIRQPLSSSQIEVLKNELRNVQRKVVNWSQL